MHTESKERHAAYLDRDQQKAGWYIETEYSSCADGEHAFDCCQQKAGLQLSMNDITIG